MHTYFNTPCSTQDPLSVFTKYLHFPTKCCNQKYNKYHKKVKDKSLNP